MILWLNWGDTKQIPPIFCRCFGLNVSVCCNKGLLSATSRRRRTEMNEQETVKKKKVQRQMQSIRRVQSACVEPWDLFCLKVKKSPKDFKLDNCEVTERSSEFWTASTRCRHANRHLTEGVWRRRCLYWAVKMPVNSSFSPQISLNWCAELFMSHNI